MEIKNAPVQADGFDREVFVRVPRECGSKSARHIWKLRAPPFCLNGAPGASRRYLRKYLAGSVGSLTRVGFKFEASWADPRFCWVFRKSGMVVGPLDTHIDDVLGCGKPDQLSKVWRSLEKSCVCVGVKLEQEVAFSVTSPQDDFPRNPKFLPTSPMMRAGRREPSSMDDTEMRQRK